MATTMTIRDVLSGVRLSSPLDSALAESSVAGLAYDSRRVEKGFLFFAFPGARADGREFAQQAVERGALAVVSELPPPEAFCGSWIQVEHGRKALAVASRTFFERPDEKIAFTGITGTNGKTTTAYLIDAVLREAGDVTGVLGTIEYRLAGEVRPAPNTTPESLDMMAFASDLIKRGGTHLISEVSSHALALGRVFGVRFHTAVFTNLTQDHLDFHKTMEEYAAAKRLLFAPESGGGPQWAALNADDPGSQMMIPGAGTQVIWYGTSDKAELRAENLHSGFEGLRFDLLWKGGRFEVASSLIGRINVSNILAAVGAGLTYGLDVPGIVRGIRKCPAVPGRFERIDCGQSFLVAVDYAHTDDALRNLIQIARELTSARVITLLGCGGDRDRSKRPRMGMVAAELSDLVVVTSDNPQSEDPLSIMNDVLVGVGRFDTPHIAEPDRGKAIQIALGEAKPGDVVLLAGKGHERYQILKDGTIDFDDRETARQVLRSFGYEKGHVTGREEPQ